MIASETIALLCECYFFLSLNVECKACLALTRFIMKQEFLIDVNMSPNILNF